MIFSFENMTFPKEVNYLLRKYDCLFEDVIFRRKLLICFDIYNFSFEDMNVSKKVSYLLRKYDLFIQEYANVTPKQDDLTLFECFLGKPI